MKLCPSCQRAAGDDAAFCAGCGSPLAAYSPPAALPVAAEVLPQDRRTPSIAIWGIVLAFIPFLCLNFVGAILGIVALSKISSEPKLYKGTGLAVTSIVVGFGWIVVGILSAIAIPSVIRFQARAKQSEAKANLKMLSRTQQNALSENGRYATTFADLGFVADGGTRYTYYLGTDAVLPTTHPQQARPSDSYAEAQRFRIVAVSNLDTDEALDIWVVDESGNIVNEQDDTGL